MTMPIEFATVEEAAEEFRQGRQIVVVDDEDRENEGDLVVAAEKTTPAAINFMAKHGRGLICLALTEERCDELNLPLMSPVNTSNFGTAFTESIDAVRGTTTGISAADRAITILAAIDPATRPATFSPCARGAVACWFAPDRPKLPWIWLASPGFIPRAWSARS